MTEPADFNQHYLQIQALSTTQADQQTPTISPKTASNLTLIITFAIALTVIIAGAFLMSRMKKANGMLNTFKLALLIAITPLAMTLASNVTELRSNAGPQHTPTAFNISLDSPDKVTVTWNTASEAVGGLKLSKSPQMVPLEQTLSDPLTPTTKHSFSLTHLKPNTTYYLQIYSEGKWYHNGQNPITFETP